MVAAVDDGADDDIPDEFGDPLDSAREREEKEREEKKRRDAEEKKTMRESSDGEGDRERKGTPRKRMPKSKDVKEEVGKKSLVKKKGSGDRRNAMPNGGVAAAVAASMVSKEEERSRKRLSTFTFGKTKADVPSPDKLASSQSSIRPRRGHTDPDHRRNTIALEKLVATERRLGASDDTAPRSGRNGRDPSESDDSDDSKPQETEPKFSVGDVFVRTTSFLPFFGTSLMTVDAPHVHVMSLV